MTKLQLINGIEEITNELKGIEEAEFTSCITYEAIERLNTLFDTFEEEFDGFDFETYDPKNSSLSHIFPSVQDLFNLSIRQSGSKENEVATNDNLPDYLKASLSLLGV